MSNIYKQFQLIRVLLGATLFLQGCPVESEDPVTNEDLCLILVSAQKDMAQRCNIQNKIYVSPEECKTAQVRDPDQLLQECLPRLEQECFPLDGPTECHQLSW